MVLFVSEDLDFWAGTVDTIIVHNIHNCCAAIGPRVTDTFKSSIVTLFHVLPSPGAHQGESSYFRLWLPYSIRLDFCWFSSLQPCCLNHLPTSFAWDSRPLSETYGWVWGGEYRHSDLQGHSCGMETLHCENRELQTPSNYPLWHCSMSSRVQVRIRGRTLTSDFGYQIRLDSSSFSSLQPLLPQLSPHFLCLRFASFVRNLRLGVRRWVQTLGPPRSQLWNGDTGTARTDR